MHFPTLALAAAALFLAAGCQRTPTPAAACGTPATIRNLAGLDGCGYVLELAGGQQLEPHGATWNAYAKHDGELVSIGYEPTQEASICMAGQGVLLNCIQARSN